MKRYIRASKLVWDYNSNKRVYTTQTPEGSIKIVTRDDNGKPFFNVKIEWKNGDNRTSPRLNSLAEAKDWAEDIFYNKTRTVKASTDTRDKISFLENRISSLKEMLNDPYFEGDPYDVQQRIEELEEELNFAWQDDEAEYNYALEQQEFNPDGSLKGYPVESCDAGIHAAEEIEEGPFKSICSFDFIHDGNYNSQELASAIEQAFEDAGVTAIGVDFRDVDYSGYPGYEDKIVSQCGVDFEWKDNYYQEAIENEVGIALDNLGYELIGISFDSWE